MFNKFKKMNIAQRKNDEDLYSIVAQEMESGVKNNGLWLKALEKAGGVKEKQVAEYIKLRVQSLKDDLDLYSELSGSANQISRKVDLDEFISFFGKDGYQIEKIKEYLSGLSAREKMDFINQPDSSGNYPVHIAARTSRPEILRWLLDIGANPNPKNYWGNTALDIAEKREDQEVIAILSKALHKPPQLG